MTREEAIETIRRCCPRVGDSQCDFETAMRELIPELRESEDERIRRELIGHCKDLVRMNKDNKVMLPIYEPWLAWLEKQKDCILVPKSHLDPVGEPGVDGMKILEKQKENHLGKYSEEEELAYRLNWVMQDYYKAGEDEEEREHRQYKDWIERLQEFCGMPDDEREKAVKVYREELAAKQRYSEFSASVDFFNRMFGLMFH